MTEELKKTVEPLLLWFDGNARVLPWRDQPTPYRVWVSEIMLQQTRVEAVKPYYRRFMEALPTIKDLAECEEERLLKLWEGLGYYNRVRNMQEAAKTVMTEYGGELPKDYKKLLGLKGIGSYTAGAVASIAYGLPYPAVDGNVLRVLSRVTLDNRDVLNAAVKKDMERELALLIPKERPGAFNQALMELGATVCVPNGMAKCEECPLQIFCMAHAQGRVMEFPVKKQKKARRIEDRTVLLIQDGERTAIQKRPDKGLLAGLYEFPNVKGHLSQQEVLWLLKKQGFSPIRIRELESAKHIFSHIEWHMIGYAVKIEDTEQKDHGYLFVEPSYTEKKYPIPAAFEAYTNYLQIRLGQEKYHTEE